jgi:hypothetical protein
MEYSGEIIVHEIVKNIAEFLARWTSINMIYK